MMLISVNMAICCPLFLKMLNLEYCDGKEKQRLLQSIFGRSQSERSLKLILVRMYAYIIFS